MGPKRRRRTIQISPKKVATEPKRKQTKEPDSSASNEKLSMEKFSPGDNEKFSQTKLQKEVFAYFLQKLSVQNLDSGKVLKPMREFLLPSAAQLMDSDPSLIY